VLTQAVLPMAVSIVSPGKLWRRTTYGDLESGKGLLSCACICVEKDLKMRLWRKACSYLAFKDTGTRKGTHDFRASVTSLCWNSQGSPKSLCRAGAI